MTDTSLCPDSVDALVVAKGSSTIAVCLPAHNEAATVGQIIDTLRSELQVAAPLLDEIIVLDDASSDATAQVSAQAGARVVASHEVLPDVAPRRGKGEVMWRSLAAVNSDIIVWVDADIVGFDAAFVTRLVAPLLTDPHLRFVKGHYARPVGSDGTLGGRVTELVARPALSMYFPQLADFPQPLSGEIAARRAALTALPIAAGYGVDVGLLIDVTERYGIDSIARADLGVRVHRNRPLDQLAPQAYEVLHTILRRAGQHIPPTAYLIDAGGVPVETKTDDRPPIDSLRGLNGT